MQPALDNTIRYFIIKSTVFACCDFIAQFILVRGARDDYYSNYSFLNLQRYTVVGLCGAITSAS